MRLFRTITLMLVLLTAVPVTVVGLILIDSTVEIVKTQTWEIQQERAERAGREASAYFENIIDDLDLLVSNLDVADMSIDEQQKLLGFILQKRPEVNIIGFYDHYGRPLRNLQAFDSGRILPSELAGHQQKIGGIDLRRVEAQALAFSAAYEIHRKARPELEIDARHETAVALLVRVQAGGAAFLGMELSLEPLKRLVDRLRSSQRGQLLLVDSDLARIAHSAGEHTPAGDIDALDGQLPRLLGPLADGSGSARRVSGARPVRMPDDRELLVAYSPLVRPDWLMVSTEPLDDVYKASRRMFWQVLLVVAVSLLVAVGLGVLFAFGLTRPIAKLVRGSLAIARGKFGTQLTVRTRNELSELAHTFNYMSNQLLYYDEQTKELVASLEKGYLETLRALARSIDAKDPYTAGHSDRVTEIALQIGRELGLDSEQMKFLRYAGIMHDIGKIGIRDAILGKKGRLTDEEFELVRQHPVIGENIIEPIDFLQPVRPLVLHHHEWIDGSGYPAGLSGDQIPLGARILAAADTFDAVTSERPYQKAVSEEEAIGILKRLSCKQLDPDVCDALIRVIERQIAGEAAEA